MTETMAFEKAVRRAPAVGRRNCFFAALQKEEDAPNIFVMFDEETGTVYHSEDVLSMGRVKFRTRAVPIAEVDAMIPAHLVPKPDIFKKEESRRQDEHETSVGRENETSGEEIVSELKRKIHGEHSVSTPPTTGNKDAKVDDTNGWTIKAGKESVHIRKANSELWIDIPIQVDKSLKEITLVSPSTEEMLFLYHIMTNIGLTVNIGSIVSFEPPSKENETIENKETKETKDETNVTKNVLRKLNGNGFHGVEWNLMAETTATPEKPRAKDKKAQWRRNFWDGILDRFSFPTAASTAAVFAQFQESAQVVLGEVSAKR